MNKRVISKTFIIVLLALLSSHCGALAQTLTGRVVDEENKTMAGASVCLLSPKDSSFLSGTITDENGRFHIKSDSQRNLLRITMIGYDAKYLNRNDYEDIGDIKMTPSSKLLKGITVTGNHILMKNDKMIINVPENIKRNSFDGYAALSALTIPGLTVNPIDYKVTSNIGEVLLCINGREVEADEIRTLNPKDIKKIEYYQNFDPNHPNASCVIDFLMKSRDDGGLLYSNVKQNLNIGKGDGILDLKHYRKKAELNFQLSGNYRHYTLNRGEESATKMTFNDFDVTKKSEILNTPLRLNNFKSKLSWLRRGKNDMWQIAAYLSKAHDVYDQNMLQTYSANYSAIHTEDYTHKDNLSPALQIYYQRMLKNNGLFRASIYGNYNHTDKERNYTSTTSFSSTTKENMYTLRPNIFVGMVYGKHHPFLNATYDYKFTKNKYTENDNVNNNKLSYGNGLFQIGNNYTFSKKFRMTLRLAENVVSINNGNKTQTKFFFNPSVLYNADFGRGNTMKGEIYTYVNDPQMSYYNGSSQQMDQYQILRGNPDLKNGHCIGMEHVFDSNHKWGCVELFTQYINMPKYIYEDVFRENDKFIHTYKNGRSYNHFLFNTEIRLNVIPQKLIWMFGGEYNYFKERDNKINEFVGGTTLTYLGNNFIGKIDFVSPLRYLTKGVEYKNPSSVNLSLRYTLKKLQIGFIATNPFMHSYVRTSYCADNYSNVAKTYSPKITSNMYTLTLSYRLSYGKKHNFQDIEMDNSQSSGLLDQRDIRNEKMERSKK